jgi:8-oxo-dGTP pyrophosphatase MutT (NUDIX family)
MQNENHHTEQSPWKTLSSELVYESPWIGIIKNEVIHPSGKPGIYSTIKFKNKAIGIIPIDAERHTWIVGQFRYPVDGYSWEIPEGGGNPDVPYEASAARELMEETGIRAGKLTPLMTMHLSNSASDEESIVFVATDLSFGQAEPEETEVLQVKRIHFDTLYDMVMSNQITDAITVAAVLKISALGVDSFLR